MAMNNVQLCRHVVSHFRTRAHAEGGRRLSRDDAREFLEELQRLRVRELTDVGHFSISKIAKLVAETRHQRRGRDPITGKEITIPARSIVRARVSSRVRDAVEGPL